MRVGRIQSGSTEKPLPCVKQIASGQCSMTKGAQSGALHSLQGWDGAGHGREVQEGSDISILRADQHCCMAETNTIV